MAVDVSRGDSEDSSSIEIIDITDMKQVLEWVGKIQPDLLAELVYNFGMRYNAYTVVDITGGMGVTTVLKLIEMDYKLLHYDDPRSKILSNNKKFKKHKTNENKIPGFNVGAYRVNMIAEFEKAVRTNELKIRSSRTTSEMKTFVYRNGRPDHMDGFHDDCIMAIAMGLWVVQYAFKNLEKFNNQVKSMLNSWVNSSTSPPGAVPHTPKKTTAVHPSSYQPKLEENNNESEIYNPAPPNLKAQDYQEYSWLFGIPKR
jgi:hypothetical protein